MPLYIGVFFIALAGLVLQIALVRLLSVTTWYHLAFFSISTAMLGMTAGATHVFLRPERFAPDRLARALSTACLQFALSLPATLGVICLLPLDLYPSLMSAVAVLFSTLACSLPSYFAGVAISAVLTKPALPIGRLYGSDLVGAALGCLLVLLAMEHLDAASVILLAGAAGAVAALAFGWHEPGRWRALTAGVAAGLALFAALNAATPRGMRPIVVKGNRFTLPYSYAEDRWNSFSRISMTKRYTEIPQYWGPSPVRAPLDKVEQHYLVIDGEAGTNLRRFHQTNDIEHLRYDMPNLAYHLDRRGAACVIGVGGGRDVQSALLFGFAPVTGVELNPIFIDLLENEYADFAGLAGRPDVRLVRAEARQHLSSAPDRFQVLQMSMIDTWAATGAGAFSLSENALYTVEAWSLFLDRLAPQGVFTVSRWHNPDSLGETGRVISTAVAALHRRGVRDPSRHVVLTSLQFISTLLVSPQPFSDADLARLQAVCADMSFKKVLFPGEPPRDPMLGAILASPDAPALAAAVADADLNYLPATDESPYFFNMLRLGRIQAAFASGTGVLRGNLNATLILFALVGALSLLALLTIVLPLWLRARRGGRADAGGRTLRAGACYFSLIGAGFMLAEIALVQRLTVLLSHPIYALGVLLFSLILGTGLGSLLSDRLPLTRRPWLPLLPLAAAGALLGLRFLTSALIARHVTDPLPLKIALSVAVVFPLGMLLGLFFPTGMKLARAVSAAETPWYWALNGIFGVLCSALAVVISIYLGISVNFYVAAACYAALLLTLPGLTADRPTLPEPRDSGRLVG
jgi:spermidine synthase